LLMRRPVACPRRLRRASTTRRRHDETTLILLIRATLAVQFRAGRFYALLKGFRRFVVPSCRRAAPPEAP
jgi:hypothetical protein